MSPTQRTMNQLRRDGWTVEKVERRNAHTNVTNDLFGFIDVLALRGPETLAVQVTSDANVAARVRKVSEHPNVGAVREAGWAIHVVGWKKVGRFWQARTVDVS